MNDKTNDNGLPSVAGRMEMTHEDFQRACRIGTLETHTISRPVTGQNTKNT